MRPRFYQLMRFAPVLARIMLAFMVSAVLPALPLAPGAWKIDLGHAGYVVPGSWVPLRITLGSALGVCRLELQRLDVRGDPNGLESWLLQAGSDTEIPFYYDEFATTLQFRLLSDGVELGQARIEVGAQVFPGHVILVIGQNAAVRSAIGKVLFPAEPVLVLPVKLLDLPTQPLNWDAISAVVMEDPGPVLAPQIRDAMLNWISGGGHLVLTKARSVGASVADQLSPPGGLPAWGMGSLRLSLAFGDQSRGTAYWKELLDLPAFAQSKRLVMRHLHEPVTPAIKKFPSESDQLDAFAIFGIIWALGLGGACLLPRHWLPLVMSLTLGFGLVGFLAQDVLVRHWDRGLAIHSRVLVMPGGRMAWFASGLWRPELNHDQFYNSYFSPWGLTLGWGDREEGICRLGVRQASVWSHASGRTGLALRRSSTHSLQLETMIPLSSQALQLTSPYRVRLTANGQGLVWSKLDNQGKLFDLEAIPEAFLSDQTWLAQVLGYLPQAQAVVGLSDWPDSQLVIGGQSRKMVCWVRPQGRLL